MRKTGVYQPQTGWGRFLLSLLLANGVLGGISFWLMGAPSGWLEMDLWARVGQLSLIVAAGILVYFFILALMGLRPRHLRGDLF
ncbi:MAG TPA: hypothetical protein DEA26_09050 [Oceanospirillales bacterium]|nr:hypothetical protein [Oceanospirillales bacterium]